MCSERLISSLMPSHPNIPGTVGGFGSGGVRGSVGWFGWFQNSELAGVKVFEVDRESNE